MKNKKKKGFTLIELVVVIAIIGILAAVLIPGYNYFMNSARESSTKQEGESIKLIYEAVELDSETDLTTNGGVEKFVKDLYDALIGEQFAADSIEITLEGVTGTVTNGVVDLGDDATAVSNVVVTVSYTNRGVTVTYNGTGQVVVA